MIERYEPGNIVFGSWSIVKKIGEGSFGKIYEIEKEDFGNVYKAALKVITLPQNQAEVNSFFDKQSICLISIIYINFFTFITQKYIIK